MDNKNLNALDGSSVLAEVTKEKIESQRKSYKVAIKNAFIRHDKAQESATKAVDRAEKTRDKLDSLVAGGLEGFLINKAKEEANAVSSSSIPKKTYKTAGNW